MRRKTAFDKYLAARMKDAAFAKAFRGARAEIASIDALVRSLDKARLLEGVSKAELARRIGMRPEVVRRLFTARSANPTLDTTLRLVRALGLRLHLQPSHEQEQAVRG